MNVHNNSADRVTVFTEENPFWHMTHSNIISHLYSDFSRYRELWEKKWEDTEKFGAFVFLPGKELDWEWWGLNRIHRHIECTERRRVAW